jgi:hypothetical protein
MTADNASTWVGVAGFEPAASSSRTKEMPLLTDADSSLNCQNIPTYDQIGPLSRTAPGARMAHARLTPMSDSRQLLDALAALREALDIPNAATVGDQETRDAILVERAGHAVVMLAGILGGDDSDIPWSTAYLRARLAEHPAAGYKTWDERVAELDAAKTARAVTTCT